MGIIVPSFSTGERCKETGRYKMKKLVFDFDGTLVDSMREWSRKMTAILEQNNIPYPANIIEIVTPLGDKGTAKYFIEELGLQKNIEEIVADMDKLAMEDYTYNIPAKETVAETLIKLKEKGYSLNVLTASPHRMLDVCLKRIGLYNMFDNIWSCEDFKTTKSDINIYYSVAKGLNTTVDNCIFLDDNINALRVGKSSGMEVIGVYDASSEKHAEEIKELCSHYVYKFEELLEVL